MQLKKGFIQQVHSIIATCTKVELNAEEESYLDIKEDSKFVGSLVQYSADGGGNISLRVAGK